MIFEPVEIKKEEVEDINSDQLYYRRDTVSERVSKYMSPEDQGARLYYGNTYLGPLEDSRESWSWGGYYGKRFVSGTVGLGASAVKAGISAKEFIADTLPDWYKGYVTEMDMGNFKHRLNIGDISQEQYDEYVKDYSNNLASYWEQDAIKWNEEKKQTSELLRNVDNWTQRFIKKIGAEAGERTGVAKWFGDVAESSPTMLASVAAFAITKNPATLAAFSSALTGITTFGETTQQALEKGASLEDAVRVGAITADTSAFFESFSGYFLGKLWEAPLAQKAAKNAVMNKLASFIDAKAKGGVLTTLKIGSKAALPAAGEEFVTESSQAAAEKYIPRFFGYGDDFESWWKDLSDIAYQGWIGALSGGLFGGMGTTASAAFMHRKFKSMFKKSGLSEEDSVQVADTLTTIFSKKSEEATQILTDEMSKPVDDAEMDSLAKTFTTLFGGAKDEEISKIRQNFEKNASSKTGNKETAKVYAAIATATANLESNLSGVPLSEVAGKYKIEMQEDNNIDPTDKSKTLFAKDKEGKVIGAAPNSTGERIIKLAKSGDSLAIVHEAAHLMMNVVAETYARFKADPSNVQVHPIVETLISRYGEPSNTEVQGYFNEEQQERFASDMVRMILEGETITPELDAVVKNVRKTLHTIDTAISDANLADKDTRSTFSKIFAKEEAVLPDEIPTQEGIKELKEAINTIKQGGKPSIKHLKQIAQFIRFGKGSSPYTVGYTMADFIKERKDVWDKMSAKEKYNALKKFGFEVDPFLEMYKNNVEEFIKAAESQANSIVLEEDVEAKKVQNAQARYNEAKEVYLDLFEGQNIDDIINKIDDLRKKGYAVINKETVEKMVQTLTNLSKELKDYKNKDVASQRKIDNNIIRYANTILENLELMGIDTSAIRNLIKEAENSTEKREIADSLLNRMKTIADTLSIRYFKSESFLTQEGIMPPTYDNSLLASQVAFALVKALKKGATSDTLSMARVVSEVSKMLSANKIPTEVKNKILAELGKKNFLQLTRQNSFEIIKEIIDNINKDYQKKMVGKINSLWKDLMKSVKKRDINPKDYAALKWINDKIMSGREDEHKLVNLDLDAPIAKDADTNQDIFLSFEHKQIAEDLIKMRIKEHNDNLELGNEMLADTYVNLSTMANITQSYPEYFENKEKQRIADFTNKALELVKGRKALPGLAQRIDSIMFAGPLAGLRSNLIAVFGENFASVYDTLVEERYREQRRMGLIRNVKDSIEKVLGVGSDYFLASRRADKPFQNANPNTLEYILKDFSRGQLLDIWLASQQEKGIESLSSVLGIGKDKKEARIKQTKEIIKKIESLPNFRVDKSFGIMLRESMRTLHKDLSDTNMKVNGKPVGFVENYWPLTIKSTVNGEVVNDMNFFNYEATTKKAPGFTIERVGLSEGQKLDVQDPFERFERYVNNATKFIYLVPKLNDISKMLANEQIKEQIISKFGGKSAGEAMYDALVADVQYNLGLEKPNKLGILEKMYKEVVSNYIIGSLGFKLWTALKQVPSFINFSTKMPAGSFFSYVTEAFTSPKETWNYMMNTYSSVKSRYMDALPTTFGSDTNIYQDGITAFFGDISYFGTEKGAKKMAKVSAAISKTKQWAMHPIRLMDSAAIVYGGYAYQKYLKESIEADPKMSKMTEVAKRIYIENALIEAMETTQQSGFNTTKGSWQRSDNAVAKSLMAFTSANVQFSRKIRESWYKYRNGEIDASNFGKVVTIYGILNPLIYAIMSNPASYLNLFKSLLGDDDDSYKDELYLTLVRPFVDNIFSSFGVVGNISETVLADIPAKLVGQKVYGSDISAGPFFMGDIDRAVKKFSKKKLKNEDILEGILSMAQSISPVPLQTTKKMLKGVKTAYDKHNLFYSATLLGIPEGQVDKLIKEIEK